MLTYFINPKELQHPPPDFTKNPEQLSNLFKLRDALLNTEKTSFDMGTWHPMDKRDEVPDNEEDAVEMALEEPSCGQTACAGGWGLLNEIFNKGDEPKTFLEQTSNEDFMDGHPYYVFDFDEYIDATFIPNSRPSETNSWLFSHYWEDVDNTPIGAAARIDIAIHYGVSAIIYTDVSETYRVVDPLSEDPHVCPEGWKAVTIEKVSPGLVRTPGYLYPPGKRKEYTCEEWALLGSERGH